MWMFLNLFGLVFAASAVIPIVIHFLQFHRRSATVPSLLLFTGFQKRASRRRLYELLLLLLRCLLLMLVALILAVPMLSLRSSVCDPREFRPVDSVLAIFLDDSPRSMHCVGGRPAFELLRERLRERLRRLPPDARVCLATASSRTATDSMSPDEALKSLDSMSVVPDGGDLPAAVRSFLKRAPERGITSAALLLAALPGDTLCRTMNPAQFSATGKNDGFALNAVTLPGMDTSLDPSVSSARWASGGRGIEVRFGGAPVRLAASELCISSPDGSNDRRFPLSPVQQVRGTALLPLEKTDADVYSGGMMVAMVSASSPALGRSSASSGLDRWFVPPPERGKTPGVLIVHDSSEYSRLPFLMFFTVFDSLQADRRFDVLAWNLRGGIPPPADRKFAAVIVPPLESVSPALNEFLASALKDGSSVIIFPQDSSVRFHIPGLPDKLNPVWREPNTASGQPLGTGPSDFSLTPYIALFNKGISRTIPDLLASFIGSADDLPVYYADGVPYLTLRRTELPGELVLFAVPLNPLPASLLLNPVFPELLVRLAGLTDGVPGGFSFLCGQTLMIPRDFQSDAGPGEYLLSAPDGASERFFCLPGNPFPHYLEQPGFHRLKRTVGAAETVFAVNLPRVDTTFLTETAVRSSGWNLVPAPDAPLLVTPLAEAKDSTVHDSSEAASNRLDLVPFLALLLAFLMALETGMSVFVSIRKERAVIR